MGMSPTCPLNLDGVCLGGQRIASGPSHLRFSVSESAVLSLADACCRPELSTSAGLVKVVLDLGALRRAWRPGPRIRFSSPRLPIPLSLGLGLSHAHALNSTRFRLTGVIPSCGLGADLWWASVSSTVCGSPVTLPCIMLALPLYHIGGCFEVFALCRSALHSRGCCIWAARMVMAMRGRLSGYGRWSLSSPSHSTVFWSC
jgi:hypothetical protein